MSQADWQTESLSHLHTTTSYWEEEASPSGQASPPRVGHFETPPRSSSWMPENRFRTQSISWLAADWLSATHSWLVTATMESELKANGDFFFFWPRNTHRLSFLDSFTWFVGHRAQLLDQDLLQHLSKPIHTQHRSPEEWWSVWDCRHPGALTAPMLSGMREKGFLRFCLPVVHIYSQSTSNTYSLSELDLRQHSSGTANRTKTENWTE